MPSPQEQRPNNLGSERNHLSHTDSEIRLDELNDRYPLYDASAMENAPYYRLLRCYALLLHTFTTSELDLTSTDDEVTHRIYETTGLFRQITSRIRNSRDAKPKQQDAQQELENAFTALETYIGARDDESLPHPTESKDSQILKRIHDLGGRMNNFRMALKVKSQPLAKSMLEEMMIDVRSAYAILRDEILPVETVPTPIHRIHTELMDIYLLHRKAEEDGEYILEFDQHSFLNTHRDSTVLMDPSDLSGFWTNIYQNLKRRLGAKPKILRITYSTQGAMLAVTIEDQAGGFDATILEHGFIEGYTTHQDGRGIGMSDYQKRFASQGIDMRLENYVYDISTPDATGARIVLLIPLVTGSAPSA